MTSTSEWSPFAKVYDPIKCGNIDGIGSEIHDGGIWRAVNSRYRPNKGVTGRSDCTLFVGKLNSNTTEEVLKKFFTQFGKVVKLSLVRDLVTGYSKRYAFVEYSTTEEVRYAHNRAHGVNVDGANILVEYEFERNMPGWIPRRFGGGFGGRKESGQLRFGCRMRPFKKPYIQPSHDKKKQSESTRFVRGEIRSKCDRDYSKSRRVYSGYERKERYRHDSRYREQRK